MNSTFTLVDLDRSMDEILQGKWPPETEIEVKGATGVCVHRFGRYLDSS